MSWLGGGWGGGSYIEGGWGDGPGLIGPGGGGGGATSKNKHKSPPKKAQLHTYSVPLFSFNSASFYGLVIPVSLGRRAIVGVPVWSSPLKTLGNNRFLDFAVSLGYQGAQFDDLVATNVSRIWADGTLIYDATAAVGWNTAAQIDFKVYKGTEDQMPDPVLVSWLGADQGIAFRGEIIIVFYDFPITKYNLSHVPVIRAEIRDTYTQFTHVYDVARIGGATAVRTISLIIGVDWYRRRLYQYDVVTNIVHCYDLLNMIELFQFSSDAIGFSGFLSPFPGAFYVEQRFGYIITSEGTSNRDPQYCIDPTTGNVLGSFGTTDSAISNTDVGFVAPESFCEMTQEDKTGEAFILSVSVFFGDIGITKLTAAGDLSYVWCPNDVNTIFDVFEIIGEGAINSRYRWCCPGDVISGVPGNPATAIVASYTELGRVVVTVDPRGSASGSSMSVSGGGRSGYQVRHDLLWRPPLGHLVNWIFHEDGTDDIIVFHRDGVNNDMFFSRVHIDDNLRGKTDPDPGTSGSTTGYATTLWSSGPITRIPNLSYTSDAAGAAVDSNDYERYNGWQFSNIGSTHTLGYTDTGDPLNRYITVVNTQDGSWAVHNISNQFLLDGEDVGGTGGLMLMVGQIWDGDSEQSLGWSFIGSSGAGYTFGPARITPFVTSSGDEIPLYTILSWLMQYAGFAETDLGISTNLDDTFTGALVANDQNMSVWDMLDDMAKALQFEVFESEGKVKMTKVGRGTQLTVTYTLDADDDLLSVNAGDDEGKGNNETNPGQASSYAGFTTERDWHQDVPQTIELHYLDETQEYTVNVARANKTTFPIATTENDNVERLDVPLIMSPQKAFAYAARALYDAYAGQTQHEMRLGSKYLGLEPGDVVSLTINEMDYVLKVTEGTINADYSMQVLGTSFANTEVITVSGENPINDQQVVAGPAISQGFIVDTPPLNPADAVIADTALRVYTEVSSYGQAGWLGAEILFSELSAGPYSQVWSDTVTGGSYVGVAASGISGGLSSVTDLSTTMEVNFTVLPTVITGSTGYLLVGKANRWEFMSYGTVVAGTGSSRQYFFSNLVRGLRGTEWHMGDHQPGDTVLLYPNPSHLGITTIDLSKLDSTIYYKAVGINEDEDLAAPHSFVENANFEKPWAPTSLKARTVSGGSSALTLSWLRRTRLEYSPLGTTAAQPLESGWTEQYEIEILGPTGNVLRTVTGALTNSYTYASGDVTTDFGSVPATLSFNVYQISPVVGRGFAGSITTDVLSAT